MSEWESRLLATVAIAMVANVANPRGLLWLSLGALDYLLTSWWHDEGLPLHPLFTAVVDFAVCLSIYLVCRWRGGYRWELSLFLAFQLAVLGDFAAQAGLVSSSDYALWLEIANWLALAVLIVAGTTRLMDVLASHSPGWHPLHSLVRSISARFTIDPWYRLRWAPA